MVVPEFRDFCSAELRLQQERYRTRADRFRAEATEAFAQWRLGVLPPRYAPRRELELFRSGIAEIASLRLRIAYMPLFQGLERIQARIKILETVYSREDPYAPPPRRQC